MMVVEIFRRYKFYIRDFGLSIISSMIITVTTSLIVNPFLAVRYSEDIYGQILTLCGFAGVLSSTFGNALNNVKLINKNGAKENYNAIIMIVSFISAVAMFILSFTLCSMGSGISILLAIHALFTTINLYYSVTYRIKINYVQNLKYNIVVSIAYILGLFVSFVWDMWPIIYILADLVGFVYLFKTSFLFKDSFKINSHIKPVLAKYSTLILSSLLGQTLLYLDRFIIYPMVGSSSVAVYSTASFFGKSIGLVMAPIAVVLLSYYADTDKTMSRVTFWKINVITILTSVAFILASILLSPFITKLIYPTLYEASQPYLLVANIAAVINITATMTNPSILKFCDIKWQMYITVAYGLVYVSLGMILIHLQGLWGFAIASIIANVLRLLTMYAIGHFTIESKQNV